MIKSESGIKHGEVKFHIDNSLQNSFIKFKIKTPQFFAFSSDSFTKNHLVHDLLLRKTWENDGKHV